MKKDTLIHQANSIIEGMGAEMRDALKSTQAEIRERAFSVLNADQPAENSQYLAVALATKGYVMEALAYLDMTIKHNLPISAHTLKDIYKSSLEYCSTISNNEQQVLCDSIDHILQRITHLEPHTPSALFILQGDHKQILGQGDEAIELYNQAIELGSPEAYARTAEYYEGIGEYKAAFMVAHAGYEIHKEARFLHHSLALLCAAGDIEEARKIHERLVEVDPENTPPLCLYTELIESDSDLQILELYGIENIIRLDEIGENETTEELFESYAKMGSMLYSAELYIQKELEAYISNKDTLIGEFFEKKLTPSDPSMRMLWLIQYTVSVLMEKKYLETYLDFIEQLVQASNNPIAVINAHVFFEKHESLFVLDWIDSQNMTTPRHSQKTTSVYPIHEKDSEDDDEIWIDTDIYPPHRSRATLVTAMHYLQYLNHINLEYIPTPNSGQYKKNQERISRIYTTLEHIHVFLPRSQDMLDEYKQHIDIRLQNMNFQSEQHPPAIRQMYKSLEDKIDSIFGKYYRKYIQDTIISEQHDQVKKIAEMAQHDAMLELFLGVSYIYILGKEHHKEIETYFDEYISEKLSAEAKIIFSRFALSEMGKWGFQIMLKNHSDLVDDIHSLELLGKYLIGVPKEDRDEVYSLISTLAHEPGDMFISNILHHLMMGHDLYIHEGEPYLMSLIHFYRLNNPEEIEHILPLLYIAADKYKSIDAMGILSELAAQNNNTTEMKKYLDMMLLHDWTAYTFQILSKFLFRIVDKIDVTPYVSLALEKNLIFARTIIRQYITAKKYTEAQALIIKLLHKYVTSIYDHSFDQELLTLEKYITSKKNDISSLSSPVLMAQEIRGRYMEIFSNKYGVHEILQYVSFMESILTSISEHNRSEYVMIWLQSIESHEYEPLYANEEVEATQYMFYHLKRLWKYLTQYQISDVKGNDLTQQYQQEYIEMVMHIFSLLPHKDTRIQEFWERLYFFPKDSYHVGYMPSYIVSSHIH